MAFLPPLHLENREVLRMGHPQGPCLSPKGGPPAWHHRAMSRQQEKNNRIHAWCAVPLFFCFLAPQVSGHPVLQGTGRVYAGVLAANLLWSLATAIGATLFRLPLQGIEVGSGPTFARLSIPTGNRVYVELRAIPSHASVRLSNAQLSYTQQFKGSLASVFGYIPGVLLTALILGLGNLADLLRELPARVYALFVGPWSTYATLGRSIVEASALETAGYCAVAVTVFSLLPVPILSGGDILARVFAVVKRRPLSLKVMERWSQVTFIFFGIPFLWILGRTLYYWMAYGLGIR